MNDAAITSPLSTLVSHEEPAGDTQGAAGEMVLVPREPTAEMKKAVMQNGGMQAVAYALAAWPDMLAAAPAALVSHPDNGEAVAYVGSDGAVLFTEAGAEWFKAELAKTTRDGMPGRPVVPLYAAALVSPHDNGEPGNG